MFLAKHFIETFKERKAVFVTVYRKDNKYVSFKYSNLDDKLRQVDDLRMDHDEANTMLITLAYTLL